MFIHTVKSIMAIMRFTNKIYHYYMVKQYNTMRYNCHQSVLYCSALHRITVYCIVNDYEVL